MAKKTIERSVGSLEEQAKKRAVAAKEKNVQDVMSKTGWSRDYTLQKLDEARKNCGIRAKEYNEFDFHNVPIEQQVEKYEVLKNEQIAKKERRTQKKNQPYIDVVVKASGWTREHAIEMMDKAKEENGVSYEHYSIYKFWELTSEEQKTYFSKGDAEKLRKLYNTNPHILKIFMNKDLFCKNFEEFLGRPWMSTVNMDYDEFVEKFAAEKKLIYKPLASSGGHGVEVFKYDETNIREVYDKLIALPEGIIEGYLIQHPEMQKLSLNSVNTIRVVTIQTFDDVPGVEKNKVHFVYAGVRMGQGSSVVDNLHSGGMIAGINIDTGVVETNGVNFAHKEFVQHPDTGVTIKGFQIPCFDEVKALISKAGSTFPGYLGWDVAITVDGPVIVELNTHPGADGLQTPYLPEKRGMRYVIAKYLGETDQPEDKQSAKAAKSTPNSGKQPDTPYGTKISGILKEGIEFYWKKLEIADGYEVFRGYSKNGPFEPVAVIEKRSIGTYIDADFDHSKKQVFYTVRSFVNNADGTRTYSETVEAKAAEFQDVLKPEREVTYMYSGITRTMRAFHGWGEPEDAQWTSSDENVATISQDGVITAVSSGSCVLTCEVPSINQKTTTKVVVDRKACEPLGEITSRFDYNSETGFWENKAAENTGDAVIMMVGDMMCGKRQMEKQYTEKHGWNFNKSFEFVKEVTAKSDFAVGNLETLLAAGWPYMLDETYIENMNNCNATSRYLDAVRYGGFDAVALANNHNCDGGTRALAETVEQVDRYKLAHTGAFKNAQAPRFFIADVNGIKVGYVAYISGSTGFNGKDAGWAKEDVDTMLNVFDAEKAQRDIAECRKAGAEYVFAYMHWGYKNFRNVAKHQIEEAQAVAEAGADYIVGSNPHVLQKFEVIVTEDRREVPCAYSIGNFLAVMRQVTGNRDSIMLRVRLKRDKTGRVRLWENTYIPFYCYDENKGCPWAPVALSEGLNKKANKKSLDTIYNRIVESVGTDIEAYKA